MSQRVFRMSSCGLNADMETSAPLSNALSIMLCSSPAHVSIRSFTPCNFSW